MSQQIRGQDGTSAGTTMQVSSSGAAHTMRQGPDIGSVGSRNMTTTISGALTTIAAKTASAGHLYAFRNATSTATKLIALHRLKLRFRPTVAATVAQEIGFSVWRATAYTAQATGGADVTLTTPQAKLRVSLPVTEAAIHFANSTGALTAGTYTLDSLPILQQHDWNLASGAAVPFPLIDIDHDFGEQPLILAQNEGFIVANDILMANSLAGKLVVTAVWSDIPSYPQ